MSAGARFGRSAVKNELAPMPLLRVREVVLNLSLLARWALLVPRAVWDAPEKEKLLPRA